MSHDDYAPPVGTTEAELYSEVHFGEQAKKFMNSELAKYILNTAEKKVIDAQNILSKVDPFDSNEIIRQQKVISIFDHFVSSLSEIVAAGDSAYQIYLHNHSQEE